MSSRKSPVQHRVENMTPKGLGVLPFSADYRDYLQAQMKSSQDAARNLTLQAQEHERQAKVARDAAQQWGGAAQQCQQLLEIMKPEPETVADAPPPPPDMERPQGEQTV